MFFIVCGSLILVGRIIIGWRFDYAVGGSSVIARVCCSGFGI